MKRVTIFYNDTYIEAEGDEQILSALEQAMKNLKDIYIIAITDDNNIDHYLQPYRPPFSPL